MTEQLVWPSIYGFSTASLGLRSIDIARISQKNDRFRTKDDICHDLSIILNSELSYGTKYCVAFEITWVWSEFSGKHEGCKYWSEEACKVWEQQKPSVKGLIHEHLVPRKVLIHKLFSEINPSEQTIFNILDKFCIGVVVTKDEDSALNNAGLRSAMPSGWSGKDPWERYTNIICNIVEKN